MKSLPWRRVLVLGIGGLAGIAIVLAWFIGVAPRASATSNGSADQENPLYALVSSTVAPPDESICTAQSRRCFAPAAMANSYDYTSLHSNGIDGTGYTIALVDSFGSYSIANDLNNFDNAFSLKHMCGEANYTCQAGDPTFSILNVQGSPPNTPPPSQSHGTGLENHDGWAVEVSLDVEWAHATAPGANIILVTTPTAEVLGEQGFAQMMNAEQYVVDHHLADVISQSFGAGEGTFNGSASLMNLRHAFISAQAAGITVLASSGDNGTANPMKTPVKNPRLIPYPSVGWPASDPLVTGVGGTYLCTDTTTGASIDNTSPPTNCQVTPGQREIGWIAGGGGYSTLFSRPDYQNTLPAGSTFAGTSAGAPGPNTNMRGVPDIAYQASSRTGVLVYDSIDGGWFTVGGTSCGSPQWAGLVAMTDQIKGGDIGFMNPALYSIASNPSKYAADYHDVTTGNNQLDASIPGYSASQGWDAVTGLGSPDAANLLPDLAAAS